VFVMQANRLRFEQSDLVRSESTVVAVARFCYFRRRFSTSNARSIRHGQFHRMLWLLLLLVWPDEKKGIFPKTPSLINAASAVGGRPTAAAKKPNRLRARRCPKYPRWPGAKS
jgi:hypothetical protein